MRELRKEQIEFLREQYPEGSRIRLRELKDPYRKMAPGSEGTLIAIDDIGTFHIAWDDGSSLGLVIGEDSFTVMPPQTHEMKLYMPLRAELFEQNDWGDMDDEPLVLDGSELTVYADQILAALIRYENMDKAERGLMHWYGGDDSLDRKVASAVFRVEERDGRLWGVAECQVKGELTPEEVSQLKDYLTGQAADGFGEGFEQREIRIDRDSELFVQLWNDSDRWQILTEQECFAQKHTEALPELCFSVLPDTGQLICIKRGENGFRLSDWSTDSREKNLALADFNNERLGVTPAQRQAMEFGSMFGWDVPGADPAAYEAKPQMGGMSLG